MDAELKGVLLLYGTIIHKDLSKLSLIREIEAGAFENALRQCDDMPRSTGEKSEPVSDVSGNPGVASI